MHRTSLFLIFIILTLAISGCGKAAREAAELAAKKADDVLSSRKSDDAIEEFATKSPGSPEYDALTNYLAVKIPVSAARSIRQSKDSLKPFSLQPYKVLLRGTATIDGSVSPASLSFSLSKSCTWLFEGNITMFFQTEEMLIRSDTVISVREPADFSKSYEQTYSELAMIEEPSSTTGDVIAQELSQIFFRKTENGFVVDFKKPEERSLNSNTSALFTIESEQYMLDMLAAGRSSFSYKQVDSSQEQLFTEEVSEAKSLGENPFGVDLWSIATNSFATTNNERVLAGTSTLVVNSNGIPIFARIAEDNVNVEVWLSEFSVLPEEVCVPD